MQTGSEQLKAQQRIMAARGFYHGKIDGIWGPKTIEAKQRWERSGKFAPAIPNNGFPLPDRGPFPPGVYRTAQGILTCLEVENTNQQSQHTSGSQSQAQAQQSGSQHQESVSQHQESASRQQQEQTEGSGQELSEAPRSESSFPKPFQGNKNDRNNNKR